jgi:hypothetical protein
MSESGWGEMIRTMVKIIKFILLKVLMQVLMVALIKNNWNSLIQELFLINNIQYA